MIRKIFNISNFYFLLIVLMQLQDVLYKGGELISKAIIGLFVLVSFVMAVYVNLRYKMPRYFHVLNVLIIVLSVYGLFHVLSTPTDYVWATDNQTGSYTYLLNIYLSLLPIYVFYFSTVHEEMPLGKIQFWGVVLLAVSVVQFYYFFLDSTDIKGVDEITNNFGYLFVGIITLLIFYQNKTIIQYAMLACCMIMVVFSMKRGAILVATSCLVPLVLLIWRQSNQIKRVFLTLLILLFMAGGIYLIQYMLQTSEYFLTRIQDTLEGNSSLRSEIYSKLWEHFTEDASLLEQFFGGGANQTLYIAQNYAHNDWLEILINQGLCGVVLYAVYWWQFWKTRNACKGIDELVVTKSGMTICFLASGLMTSFSMSYANLPIGLSMTLGICMGQLTNYQAEHETT